MGLWSSFVELLQMGIFGMSHLYGGQLGAAIVSFSLLARLALLPVGVRLSLRARAHARATRALRPELLRLRERWRADPPRLAEETLALYRTRGLTPFGSGVLSGAILQTPLFLGLFHAVRGVLARAGGGRGFLWVGDLARPDLGVAALAGVLVGASALAGVAPEQPSWAVWVPATATFAVAMSLSAGFGLYLAAGGVVSTLQGLLVRRIEGRQDANATRLRPSALAR